MWKGNNIERNKTKIKLILGTLILGLSIAVFAQDIFYISEYINDTIVWQDLIYRLFAMYGIWCLAILIIYYSSKKYM